MSGKRMWFMTTVIAVLGGSGCCRWCERWCERTHPVPTVSPYSAAPYCQPCTPAPTYCQPVPACPPGTVANSPQWQQSPNPCR